MAATLILMRHGKSGYPAGVADFDRPLAERGVREAGLAGDWLRATQPAVDAVLCSAATRTRETLAATGISAPVSYEKSIYEASPRTLIELIQLTDDAVETLLLIGHAPGIPWTAWELAANRSSPDAEELSRKYPTSALAVLEFDRPWRDATPGTGELLRFHVPR
ncbi:SixA phosphatase family protein [Nocardia stercoris]|uniref:Histidine phosphatase family protein n=1 Tax=Nocardia stercoris TaxID=2483361 RepID=A0A3M2L3G7_9NOCA|nr:histidine phosphatase family protein [Nocardia stercoris]RMI31053.1 histidine phosphatase family protein [Nocardia stercoris]